MVRDLVPLVFEKFDDFGADHDVAGPGLMLQGAAKPGADDQVGTIILDGLLGGDAGAILADPEGEQGDGLTGKGALEEVQVGLPDQMVGVRAPKDRAKFLLDGDKDGDHGRHFRRRSAERKAVPPGGGAGPATSRLCAGKGVRRLRAMRVALFIPCFVDQFFPEVGQAMVAVLRRLGQEVVFPDDQTCCGQPAFNTGYWDEARPLARRYVEIFSPYEAVVCPSGSCTVMVRNYYPELLGRGVTVPATYEFTEFLVRQLGVTDVGATFAGKVTYHDGCHSLRELRLREEPRQLLRAVRGLELVEMSEAETCCGFGGTFAVKFPQISLAMDEVKVASIQQTGAGCVVSADPSCLLQIGGHLRRHKVPVATRHIAEVLACR